MVGYCNINTVTMFVLLLLISIVPEHVECNRLVGFANTTALSLFDDNAQRIYTKEESYYKSAADIVFNITEPKPDIYTPFIFFHQRKAGGTSIRATLHNAAKTMHISTSIICHDLPCDNYHIPNKQPFSLYAGHYQWGTQYVFNRFGDGHNRDKFSCLTNFREPVSRLISCLEFRFGSILKKSHGGCLSGIPPYELLSLLRNKTDTLGNSCLNEPFRILSGIDDEDIIDDLGVDWVTSAITDSTNAVHIQPKFSMMEQFVLHTTLANVAKCAVLVLEDTQEANDFLMKRKFPGLFAAGGFKSKNLNVQHSFDKCPPPTPEQISILERVGAFERLLYDIVTNYRRDALRSLNFPAS